MNVTDNTSTPCIANRLGWGNASIRGDTPTRPIYITTARVGTKVIVYPCYHIPDEKKHKKKQDFTIVSTKYDLVDF